MLPYLMWNITCEFLNSHFLFSMCELKFRADTLEPDDLLQRILVEELPPIEGITEQDRERLKDLPARKLPK